MLRIYDADKNVVSSGTFSAPLESNHDGKNGVAKAFLVYVRNEDPNVYYRNVKVYPRNTNTSDDMDIYGQYSNGFSVKLNYGTVAPLPFEWDLIQPGEQIVLPSDIGSSSAGDTTTYYPIWVRVNVPGNTNVQEKTNIALRIEAVKGPVS